MALIDDVKKALWINTTAYNDELTRLISAAQSDLKFADVEYPDTSDPAVKQAIITFVRVNFGSPSEQEWQRLKKSYDEQKAQLQITWGYGR